MQCLLLSSKNTHWVSLNDLNTGLLPWQQAKNILFRTKTSRLLLSVFQQYTPFLRIIVKALKIGVRKNKRMTGELCFKYDQHLIYPTKSNPLRRTNHLTRRSQVVNQFRLYRCKGMSVTAALHIFRNQGSKKCLGKLSINQVRVKLKSHIK